MNTTLNRPMEDEQSSSNVINFDPKALAVGSELITLKERNLSLRNMVKRVEEITSQRFISIRTVDCNILELVNMMVRSSGQRGNWQALTNRVYIVAERPDGGYAIAYSWKNKVGGIGYLLPPECAS